MADTTTLEGPKQDPTALTNEMVRREIEQATERVRIELNGEIKNLVTRFDGADKALDLLQARADKSPTIGELHERFEAFKALLAEMDKRYLAEFVKLSVTTEMMVKQQELALTATKEATALAMDAAEKAVQKAEVSNEKRFDSLNESRRLLADQQATFARSDMVNQRYDSLEKRTNDVERSSESRWVELKDRVTSIESSSAGMLRTIGIIVTIVGVTAAVIGVIISLS